jgi:excisionase family DNA binding protein
MLTIEEVAEILRVHHNTVRGLCRNRKLQFARIGAQLRFKAEWVDSYIHSTQARAR